ncbi:rRNA-binding endoribonuclease ASCRUDRAFT_37818 [Ascoidea rubescens DSM 1968]|uniref:20S-pre-rRNA D-site endonuclease NOB1 n=1 Tax=Ascoidea rubescens DSM 1968 TaxID=1344418 RepID=A0A1D2VC56_9ASCO|nr:hypothetical protein ASCRUDRAFT_37818 [Ascoidea rubescens DSM 1968]ODV59294.1 hypothetical protein ASCRUDRAFT_37818 [Ascoidea rubescens DSM 1968]
MDEKNQKNQNETAVVGNTTGEVHPPSETQGQSEPEIPSINSLVLDAGPLITQNIGSFKQYAQNIFTTPAVFNEVKDENARRNLELHKDLIKIRQPKPEFVKKVLNFSKLTGDYNVLSINDIHIIALTYELEVELNKGDWRLRQYPGEVKNRPVKKSVDKNESIKKENKNQTKFDINDEKKDEKKDGKKNEEKEGIKLTDSVEKTKRRRGGRKHREKEAMLKDGFQIQFQKSSKNSQKIADIKINDRSSEKDKDQENKKDTTTEDEHDSDDEGEWITSESIQQEIIKEQEGEILFRNRNKKVIAKKVAVKAALASGDFAVQNVALQINLNLMNSMNGLKINRVRNYMLRCHGCFYLIPYNQEKKVNHKLQFCPRCGGATILRCLVSVDSSTGKVTPLLKKNFEWHKRGNKYSMSSPLSKNHLKKYGKSGFQHNKVNRKYEVPLLREDQKEYQQAIKDEDWSKRQNIKMLEQWIGGSDINPFAIDNSLRYHDQHSGGVRVNRGRYANASRRRK